jgi:hypothetical protein
VSDVTFEPKSGWKRPENWVTWLGVALAGLAGMYFLNPILEFIANFAQNALVAGISLAGLAVFVFLITSADLHKLLWLAYKSAMKRMTNFVYAVYPLEIMEGFLEDLHVKQKRLNTSLGNLRGQLSKLVSKLAKKGAEHAEAMRIAQAANNRGTQPGMQSQLMFQARRANRLEKTGLTYQGLINKLKRLIALMEKVHEATGFMILDIADTIESEKEQRETVTEATKAMQAAQAILFSNQKREEFDRALEANQQHVGMQMGLLEQFEQDTKEILSSIDIENDSIKLEAIDKIEQMEQKLSGLLSGGTGNTKYRIQPLSPVFRVDGDEASEEALVTHEEVTATQPKKQFADLYKK